MFFFFSSYDVKIEEREKIEKSNNKKQGEGKKNFSNWFVVFSLKQN